MLTRILLIALFLAAVTLVGCEKKEPTLGEQVDKAAQDAKKTGDQVDQAAQKAKDQVDQAAQKAKDQAALEAQKAADKAAADKKAAEAAALPK